VGVGITLAVPEFPAAGRNLIQREAYVVGHVGIGVFVYRNRRRRVGSEYHAYPFLYPGTGDGLFHPGANVYPFTSPAGFYPDFLQTCHGFSFLPIASHISQPCRFVNEPPQSKNHEPPEGRLSFSLLFVSVRGKISS
jgi:hypothetical protein